MNQIEYKASNYSTPLIIVQARLASVRFPKKVFEQILSFKALDILLYRLRKLKIDHKLIFREIGCIKCNLISLGINDFHYIKTTMLTDKNFKKEDFSYIKMGFAPFARLK
jgi:hypothetical protein